MDEYDRSEQSSLAEQMGAMFAHLGEYRQFFLLLSDWGLIYLLKEAIKGICGPKPEHFNIQAYAVALVS